MGPLEERWIKLLKKEIVNWMQCKCCLFKNLCYSNALKFHLHKMFQHLGVFADKRSPFLRKRTRALSVKLCSDAWVELQLFVKHKSNLKSVTYFQELDYSLPVLLLNYFIFLFYTDRKVKILEWNHKQMEQWLSFFSYLEMDKSHYISSSAYTIFNPVQNGRSGGRWV